MTKQWQRPVLKVLKAGAAEAGGQNRNKDNATGATTFRS